MAAKPEKVRALLFLKDTRYTARFRYKGQPADIGFYYNGTDYGYGIRSAWRVLASCGGSRASKPVTHFEALKMAMGAFVRVFCMCEKRYNEAGRNEQP